MKNITISIAILTSISLPIYADNLFDSPGIFDGPSLFDSAKGESNSGNNSFYDSDGSLVIIRNAESSGFIVKDDGSGTKTEYYVVPKKGENTFIYNDGLTICNSRGCY